MAKSNVMIKILSVTLVCLSLFTAGCSGENPQDEKKPEGSHSVPETQKVAEQAEETKMPEGPDRTEQESREELPSIVEVDWSEYFGELNGAAVFYSPKENTYQVYSPELATTRRSPCSTFKIISSLIALETGAITPEQSTRTWSGEIFWNEDWNRDIDFETAFRTSCVWYFREVIDALGKDTVQAYLDELQYGNCDISDWEGRLNTNNSNPALTGFWIESSLKISPKEQVEVMERIFGENSEYSKQTKSQLKQVMLVSHETPYLVYGKTGMGKAQGVVVDCWFTGFAENENENLYFCVYLGETEGENPSSTQAKEIALDIIGDIWANSPQKEPI